MNLRATILTSNDKDSLIIIIRRKKTTGINATEVAKINTIKTKATIIIETTEVEEIGAVGTKDTGTGLRNRVTKITTKAGEAKNGMIEVNMMARQEIRNTVATRTSNATKNSISRLSITIQTIASTMSIAMNSSKR